MKTVDGITKFCPQCHSSKSVTEFGLDRHRSDGLQCWCKECNNLKNQKKYHNDPNVRARKAELQKIRFSDPVEYAKQLERKRAWNADPKNKERVREAGWRFDHSEHGKAKRAAREHREDVREKRRSYCKEIGTPRVTERYNTDPEFYAKVRAQKNARHHRKNANGGMFTATDWQFLVDLAQGKCLACGQEKSLTIDHIVPVELNGKSNVWNIQPLCGSCNSSKGPRTMDYRTEAYQNAVQGYIHSDLT